MFFSLEIADDQLQLELATITGWRKLTQNVKPLLGTPARDNDSLLTVPNFPADIRDALQLADQLITQHKAVMRIYSPGSFPAVAANVGWVVELRQPEAYGSYADWTAAMTENPRRALRYSYAQSDRLSRAVAVACLLFLRQAVIVKQ